MSDAHAITSRKDAKASGFVRYYTGIPCPKGHIVERYVAGWTCTACVMPEKKNFNHKAFAKSQGATIYFTGKPCRKGHTVERRVDDGRCVACLEEWSNRHRINESTRYYLNRDVINKRLRDRRPKRPKAMARAAGLEHYFTGKPCVRGHIDQRRVSDGMCLSCDGISIAEWTKRNPEATRALVIRRRARKRNAKGRHTGAQLKVLMTMQHSKCPYCRISIKAKWHVDHIQPLSKGGSNDISNIQLLCPPCNQRKNAKHPLTFARELGLLL